MSRKKTVKRAVKRQADNTASSTLQKIEKDFSAAPANLYAQISKEIASLKQQESKIKKTISKLASQVKTETARVKSVSKKSGSATAKKQLVAAQKALAEVSKSHAVAAKELHTVVGTLSGLSKKQAKVSALRKHLAQFEKTWAQNAKKQQTKTKVVRKKKAKSTTNLTVVPSTEVSSAVIEDISAHQITELAS